MTYDIIGDVHGYVRNLTILLEKLGYRKSSGLYIHPDSGRQAIFLGDLIDRGPDIALTLAIVRGMEKNGAARVVMGNHEYNAICFNTLKSGDSHRWMRKREDKNLYQHIETLYQFRDRKDEWKDYVEWFRALPLFLDLDGIRVVHAAWDPASLEIFAGYSAEGNKLTTDLLEQGTIRGNPEFSAFQNTLKGIELKLPDGITFTDKDGNSRREMRVKWWRPAKGRKYNDIAFHPHPEINGRFVSDEISRAVPGYDDDKPVFVGHYWLHRETPSVLSPMVACLDYSVAAGGYLTAYTWSGETVLNNNNFTVA
ncbi:MAG: metallophosphoesterase [Spirochaetales bacterium]|jgi:hypothetical protein|nr:metallophosphoesterase [Spirochaetales bacterium]